MAPLWGQYPSAWQKSAATPLLSEYRRSAAPFYNPAFLGLGRRTWRRDFPSRVHLQILEMLISANLLFSVFDTNPPTLEDALNSRVGELVQGLSVSFSNLNSRQQMYRDALSAYISDLTGNVIPPLAATATGKPSPSLSRAEIEADSAYDRYKNRLQGDAEILLGNLGKILADVGLSFLREQPLFGSQAYVKVFDLEILLAEQVALGFGLNWSSRLQVKDNVSGFQLDVGRLHLPSMTLDNITLPSNSRWRSNTTLAQFELGAALSLASTRYINNLASSLSAEELGELILQSLFEQSFINLHSVIEPNLRLAVGFPLADWLYIGNRFHGELLLGRDNVMVPPGVLNLTQPLKLAEYIYNPLRARISAHAGWDLSALLRPAEWFSFSVMLTDLLGLAPSKKNATENSWGQLYYPLDLHLGFSFQFPIGSQFELGFGADAHNLISFFSAYGNYGNYREQRFTIAEAKDLAAHLRSKVYLSYRQQFRIFVHYWAKSIGFGIEFDFLTFHPGLSVEMDIDLADIRIRLDILRFTS